MELVTGRAGSPHITAQQDRQLHQGIWGEEAYILNTGNMLKPEVQSSNKILIKDGALMFQGALFSVKVGTTDEITINNGNQGMQRKDLVVARYTYDSSQNIESAEWVVIQGEPAASNPAAPEGTSGDIQAGDAVVDCPFMIVNLDGINVTGVDIIPEVLQTIPELIGNLSSGILIKEYTADNKTVQGGEYAGIDVNAPVIPGYTRIIWQPRLINASSNGVNSSYCVCYRIDVDTGDDTMHCYVRNYAKSDAKIQVRLRVIYARDEFVG